MIDLMASFAPGSASADKHSAPVTHLGERILWTIVVLAVIGGIYLLMWRGWKKRQKRQADIPAPAPAPEGAFADAERAEATYVSTTSEGDWLDRIAVHGLGERSEARVSSAPAGILIEREAFGAPDVFIPAEAIQRVSRTTGMAGKYLRDEDIMVVTWQHGDRTLDTGIKFRYDPDLDRLVQSTTTERPSE